MSKQKVEEILVKEQPTDKIDKNLRHIFGLLVEKDWKMAKSLVNLMKEGNEEAKQLATGFDQLIDFLKDFSSGRELKAALKYPDSIILNEELSTLLPEMSEEDYNLLKEDISNKGILTPLIVQETPEGLLLIDGYTRYRIADELGIKRLPVVSVTNLVDPRVMSLALNLTRRHLTKEQRNEFIKAIPTAKKGRPRKEEKVIKQADLAKELGVSVDTIQRARQPKNTANAVFNSKTKGKREVICTPPKEQIEASRWIGEKDMETLDKLGKLKGAGFFFEFTKDQIDIDLLVRRVDTGMQELLGAVQKAGLESQVDKYRMTVSFEARKKEVKE